MIAGMTADQPARWVPIAAIMPGELLLCTVWECSACGKVATEEPSSACDHATADQPIRNFPLPGETAPKVDWGVDTRRHWERGGGPAPRKPHDLTRIQRQHFARLNWCIHLRPWHGRTVRHRETGDVRVVHVTYDGVILRPIVMPQHRGDGRALIVDDLGHAQAAGWLSGAEPIG